MGFPKYAIGDRVVFMENYDHPVRKGDTGVVTSVKGGLYDHESVTRGEDVLLDIKLDKGGVTSCFRCRVFKIEKAKSSLSVDLLEAVKRVSDLFGGRRPLTPVMLQLQEEVGELATEVAIATGTKHRSPSEDGVLGEAVDVAIAALDIAMLECGDVEKVKAIFERKLAKWESYK